MLFFIDESWQTVREGPMKVGVLAAVQIKSHNYNECSQSLYNLKVKHIGPLAGNLEIKGREVLKKYYFDLEAKGVTSTRLDLVRETLDYMALLDTRVFASVVLSQNEADLACANVDLLERPFLYLFERIDLYMKENHPGMVAKLIFDDRDLQFNQRLSKAVSNFFHKSRAGREYDSIIKVPFFAISTENAGIQLADIAAHIIGVKFTGDLRRAEFYRRIKNLEFVSRAKFEGDDGLAHARYGFKIIKEKEAGILETPGGESKTIGKPESSPPTSKL